MKFEQLPNEIHFDVFQYLDGTDLLRSFIDLNARFHALLYQRFPLYRFHISRILKLYFDVLCQQYLPRLSTQVVTLHLSNGRLTPGGIDLFFSYFPSFDQFTRLRSLSLDYVHSDQTKMKLIDNLPYLINLTHFRLLAGASQDTTVDQLLTNRVWSLPNLVHYDLENVSGRSTPLFSSPSVLCLSLRCVSIVGWTFQWNTLDELLRYTPNLRSLRVQLQAFDREEYHPTSSLPTLHKLTITVRNMSLPTNFFSFLQSTPSLRCLDVSLPSVLIDGHHWQRFIRAHLSKLRTLQFSMSRCLDVHRNGEEQLEQLMSTFRSSFWTVDHRWSVRCLLQWCSLHVHTTSKPDCYSHRPFPRHFKSIDPQDSLPKFDQQLAVVTCPTFFDRDMPADVRFTQLERLSLKFPIPERFWHAVPHFDRLEILTLHSYMNQFASQLQALLDRATRLRHLSVHQEASSPLDLSFLQRTSSPIRELYLPDYPLDEEQCLTVCRSPLAMQCEKVGLRVADRTNMLVLAKNLPNLRVLYVFRQQSNEDLLQWLRDRLPASCLVSAHLLSPDGIRVWLS